MGKFAVIGLGNFGWWVAKSLFDSTQEAIAVDSDKNRVQQIKSFASQAIVADATQKEVLERIGLADADAVVVSLGDNVSASTLVTLYLHEIGVKKIIVKAVNEDHAKILTRVGATEVVFPEKEIGQKIAKALIMPNVLDFLPLTDEYEIVELAPPHDFVGKTLIDLELRRRYHIQVIAVRGIIPETFTIVPSADFVIKDSDILVVLGARRDIEKIRTLE